ncbi:hypothetical protein OSCT_1834 [Oscillochloris trichoides DG-6]|uniref:Uncharacterized protein n=1 Tax=Oscillochloris trichoides DG-6 TaxID=765420 RepID=E1IET3_9CHLR|nr:hypothetical protein OSCT_1834 [Oscillochloris trichoides DG-6]
MPDSERAVSCQGEQPGVRRIRDQRRARGEMWGVRHVIASRTPCHPSPPYSGQRRSRAKNAVPTDQRRTSDACGVFVKRSRQERGTTHQCRASNRCGLYVKRSRHKRRANLSTPYQRCVWGVRQKIASRTLCPPLNAVPAMGVGCSSPDRVNSAVPTDHCRARNNGGGVAEDTPCPPLRAVPAGRLESPVPRCASGKAGVARSAPCQREGWNRPCSAVPTNQSVPWARLESHQQRRAHPSRRDHGNMPGKRGRRLFVRRTGSTGTPSSSLVWPNIASQVTPLARPANRVDSGNFLQGKRHADHGNLPAAHLKAGVGPSQPAASGRVNDLRSDP